jgi:multidrug efflux pump subunit AcrA (membrane-fusion protein)
MSNAAIGPDRILALALAIASSMGLAACGKAAPQEGGDRRNREAPEITTANAEARDEPVTLTLDGTLLADEESHVTSVVPGRVVEVMVERGSVVEEGAPLVRLRDVDYRLQAQAAQAQLEQARARLGMSEADARAPAADTLPDVVAARSNADLAQSTLERTEELARRGVLSAQALDEARSRAASAREQYATALNNARASIA